MCLFSLTTLKRLTSELVFFIAKTRAWTNYEMKRALTRLQKIKLKWVQASRLLMDVRYANPFIPLVIFVLLWGALSLWCKMLLLVILFLLRLLVLWLRLL